MRLKVKEKQKHTEIVTAIGWTQTNELYSASDDMSIWKWDMNGDPVGKLLEVDIYVTDFHWVPGPRADTLALACSDGSMRLLNKNGSLQKNVPDAHKGAITCIKWSYETSTIATVGEDGQVKTWAKQGQPRATLAQMEKPIFCVCWSPDSTLLLYCCEKNICVKPIQAGQKQLQWKAHDGCVLQADWNPANNLIISCGEDCKYKIWDSFGRNLFSSSAYEYVVLSVSWSPNGELFAVGSFEMIRLCDKTGWTYSIDKPNTGSLQRLSWSYDGTMIAGAGGNGNIAFAYIVDRESSWQNIIITLNEFNKITVTDVVYEMSEELEFKDRVINFSLGHNNLVVTTATQCYIYSTQNWHTPQILDIKDSSNLIILSEQFFCLVDLNNGLQIYNYEGRLMSNPKFQGCKVEFMSKFSVSLASDVLACIDTSNIKQIHIFDIFSGKSFSKPIEHVTDILQIGLNQVQVSSERKLIFIDANKDLFLVSVHQAQNIIKLSSMIDSFQWNDSNDSLAALGDGNLNVWYYPNAVYLNRSILDQSKSTKDVEQEIGKMPVIENFSGSQVTVRRLDGGLVSLSTSAFPQILYDLTSRGQWEKAIRLCRFIKDPTLWACLSGISLHARELNTAEIALAAIDEIDKVQFITYVKNIPSEAGRNAELALFCRRNTEAEQILITAKLYYRAIKLNVRLFRWERALDLALQFKTHIDTVLAYRQKYLSSIGRDETIKKFKELANEVSYLKLAGNRLGNYQDQNKARKRK